MDPVTISLIATAILAAIKSIRQGASDIVSLIWNQFFAKLTIAPQYVNAVRGNLFSDDPVWALTVIAHIWEDSMRNADQGDATEWQIAKACHDVGMPPLQASQVCMMWYYLWGNTSAAQKTDYYKYVHGNLIGDATAGLNQLQKDSITQFLALTPAAQQQFLASNPVSTWSQAFLNAMCASAAALGISVPFSPSTPNAGAIGTADSGGGATSALMIGGLLVGGLLIGRAMRSK